MVRILVDKIPDPIPHISQHIPLALLFVNLVLTGSARSQDSHSNIDSLSNIKLVSTQIIRNVTKHCPESGAWSLGYKGDRLSQSERSIGQYSQSQGGGEDMSHVGLMNTKEKRQTWLQAIYKCLLCLVSGCICTQVLIGPFLSLLLWSVEAMHCNCGDTISDMTPMIQQSNWYLVIGKFGNQPLHTFYLKCEDRELASRRNINWSLLNVTGNF